MAFKILSGVLVSVTFIILAAMNTAMTRDFMETHLFGSGVQDGAKTISVAPPDEEQPGLIAQLVVAAKDLIGYEPKPPKSELQKLMDQRRGETGRMASNGPLGQFNALESLF